MGGEIALADFPLRFRLRIGGTVLTRGIFLDPAAAFAIRYDGVTGAAIKIAPFFCHKETIGSDFDGLADHTTCSFHYSLLNTKYMPGKPNFHTKKPICIVVSDKQANRLYHNQMPTF